MAIYTPRGLKIRLGKAYSFALMTRLFPQVDAFRVLQLTEEVDNMASLATFIAGIVCFAIRLDPLLTGVVTGVACFGFKMAHLLGIFIPPVRLILPLSRVYSWFAGYGLLLVGLLLFGLFRVGWQGVLAFIVANLTTTALAGVIDVAYTRHIFRKTGTAITGSERSFFHAYRLCADQLGVSRSLEVSEEEMVDENWRDVLADLTTKWPLVVSRFTPD